MGRACPGSDVPGKTIVRQRLSWRLLLLSLGLLLGAYLLRHLLMPDPTILAITVVDAISGQALSGAHIWIHASSGLPVPTATTDPSGHVRLLDLPSGPDVGLQVQKAEYDLLTESRLAVSPGQQTEITLPLTPRAGGRLLVGLEDACIVEIDTASFLPLDSVVLPAAEGEPVTHLLLHPEEDWLYAVAGYQGFLLDSRTGATLAQLEIGLPSGLDGLIQTWGLSQDGQHLLVLDFAGKHVLTLEANSGRLLASSPLCQVRTTSDEVQLLPKPEGAQLSVARIAVDAGDTVPLEVLMEQSPRCLDVWYDDHANLSPDGKVLLTWLTTGNLGEAGDPQEELRIRPVELTPTHWVTRCLPGGISAVASSPHHDELYVLNDSTDTLTILALDDQGRQIRVPVGEAPEALVANADGTRVYVANRQSQTVSVVDLESARVLHTIPLSGQPLSLALREATDPH